MHSYRSAALALTISTLVVALTAGQLEARSQRADRTGNSNVPERPIMQSPVQPGPPTKGQGQPSSVVPMACPGLEKKVPQGAIDAALEDPSRVNGWGKLSNPSLPASPYNQPRRMLTLSNPNTRYHSLFNGLVFKSGCP